MPSSTTGVQEAAYLLIPEQVRAQTHLRIGRILAASTPQERLEDAIFDIVNQLNRGSHLIRHDFAVVTRLQVTLYTTLDRSDRAIEVFLDYLRRNGTVSRGFGICGAICSAELSCT